LDSTSTWRRPLGYLRVGFARTRVGFRGLLAITAIYATPALAAAYLSTTRPATVWDQIAHLGLAALTAVLGTVVVMIATTHHARGVRIGVVGASLKALPWVPRYLWTNVHTSVIFWVPVGSLLLIGGWFPTSSVLNGAALDVATVLWWLLTGVVALVAHTRTLLAPFFAIHANLPATLAVLEAWRLSGRHFALCLSTFVIASLLLALPLAATAAIVFSVAPRPLVAALTTAAPHLVWACIQVVRVTLIPAVYALYTELWQAELLRRETAGALPVPLLARGLLALTRPLPNLTKPTQWEHSNPPGTLR